MDNTTIEKRFLNIGLRADSNTIGGYAGVYYDGTPNTEFRLFDGAVERIERGAFRSLIESDDDCIVSVNHDMTTLLGRRSAGTLKLMDDGTGLRWEVPYDEQDDDHRKIARKIQKREITGCSFAFTKAVDNWQRDDTRNLKVRTLTDLKVIELGPVIFPAYKGTSLGMRAEQSLHEYETQMMIEEIERLTI